MGLTCNGTSCFRLELGDEKYKTSYKDNAGGKNVVFDEKFSFNKKLEDARIRVKVYDKVKPFQHRIT